MEPLPIGVRQTPRPPRPPAPPITGSSGGCGSSQYRPLRGPYRPHRRNFLREVIVETRKVVWPTRNDLAHNSAICLGVLGLLIGAIVLRGVWNMLDHDEIAIAGLPKTA